MTSDAPRANDKYPKLVRDTNVCVGHFSLAGPRCSAARLFRLTFFGKAVRNHCPLMDELAPAHQRGNRRDCAHAGGEDKHIYDPVDERPRQQRGEEMFADQDVSLPGRQSAKDFLAQELLDGVVSQEGGEQVCGRWQMGELCGCCDGDLMSR